MAEGVASKVFPDVFGRVQFWRIRGQLHENDILWNDQFWRAMPSRSVHNKQGDCARTDAFADFNQMLVHGLDVDGRQHQGGANATSRANGPEQIRPGKTPVARRARTASTPGPDAGQRALLPDPCFVLEPDFDRLVSAFAERFLGDGCEVFLKASWAAGSDFGCCGRTERRRKPSLRSSLPTLRSCMLTPNSAAMRSRKSTRRNRTTPSWAR